MDFDAVLLFLKVSCSVFSFREGFGSGADFWEMSPLGASGSLAALQPPIRTWAQRPSYILTMR